MSLICDKAGINEWDFLSIFYNKHPRVNILQPGCGEKIVGGHCIAVDPYFIVSDYPMESKIIGTAREINNYKSFWCSEKMTNAKLQFELEQSGKISILSKTAIMGLAFKPNIDDLRESPAKLHDAAIVSTVLRLCLIMKLIKLNNGFDPLIFSKN